MSSDKSSIQSGLAVLGRGQALFSMISVFVIGIVTIYYSIRKIMEPNLKVHRVDAIIKTAACSEHIRRKRYTSVWDCMLDIQYVVDGQTYTQKIESRGNRQKLLPESTIPIYYDKTNPKNISTRADSDGMYYAFIALAVVFMIGTYYYYQMIRKHEGLASVTGGITAGRFIFN